MINTQEILTEIEIKTDRANCFRASAEMIIESLRDGSYPYGREEGIKEFNEFQSRWACEMNMIHDLEGMLAQ